MALSQGSKSRNGEIWAILGGINVTKGLSNVINGSSWYARDDGGVSMGNRVNGIPFTRETVHCLRE